MSRDPLDKAVWTDGDFETMGWHDATVHALGLQEIAEDAELLLDLDYIVRWIDPKPPEEYFRFLVAPATLAFQSVWTLEGELEAKRTLLQIQDIIRREPENERQRAIGVHPWTIEGHNFELSFLASGFRQHFRARPVETATQRLELGERGGISFEQPESLPE